jgi:HK97 family phage major capsid protein
MLKFLRARVGVLEAERDGLQADLDSITSTIEAEKRSTPTEDEFAKFNEIRGKIDAKDSELAEVRDSLKAAEEAEVRAAREAGTRKDLGQVGEAAEVRTRAAVVSEPNPVYRKDDTSTSYFRDLALSGMPGMGHERAEAQDRLIRSQETRAGDLTTVAGAGGEFAPPLWITSEFIGLARAGRVTADLTNKQPLPAGVSSINLPKVATGTAAGVQATQNSALTDTALTTTSVSSGITTVGGRQIVSMQLLQQSGIPFDNVVLQDLAAAYAVQVDSQVLYGSNSNGQVKGLVSCATNNAFTSGSPAPASVTNANSLYYIAQKAAAAVQTSIYKAPDAMIMHPNRWAWILGSVDSSARPLVVPTGTGFNGVGTGGPVGEGFAGTFGGLPVYLDANISTTANSATNQDEIYLIRRDECWLYESPVQAESFTATYADNASVLFRVLGYLAFIGNRRSGAVQSIRGTGLIAP